ncbi:FxLYD domain-containing protein [Methanospirillum stamsii]|uniref:Uncharacterized protein n=1 Tax=Methanospirillum stamsii TaxID=1277351 RepID=A0A2V2NH79_9EURY|nr:FxLYD domain-containing protein [Methanospirillum stamsii]PWR74961.1 hypothetical protein DLD82_06965 [Methanospirillum stamsii]
MKFISEKGVIFCFIIALFLILMYIGTSTVVSDQVFSIEDAGKSFPIYDSVNYRIQNTIEKEDSGGRTCYISRPYGYVETSEDTQVNLSIRKTYIDRVSRDKAYIKGEIKNLDDKTIDVIIITFNLFNADGKQIGNAYASIDYLEPKGEWIFSTEPITRTDFKFERYGSIYTGIFN